MQSLLVAVLLLSGACATTPSSNVDDLTDGPQLKAALRQSNLKSNAYIKDLIKLVSFPTISALGKQHAADFTKAVAWLSARLTRAGLQHVQTLPTPAGQPRYTHSLVACDFSFSHSVTSPQCLCRLAACKRRPDHPHVCTLRRAASHAPGRMDQSAVFPSRSRQPPLWAGRLRLQGRHIAGHPRALLARLDVSCCCHPHTCMPHGHPVHLLTSHLFTVHRQALECVLQGGPLPVNVKLLLEGQEEIGSPHLPDLLAQHKQLLAADFVLCLDGGQISATQPSYVAGTLPTPLLVECTCSKATLASVICHCCPCLSSAPVCRVSLAVITARLTRHSHPASPSGFVALWASKWCSRP